MRRFLLLLMVSVQLSSHSSCPDSCVVCSNDAIICNKLSMIIEVPDSTKALMLTDGFIDSVDHIAISDLSNMSVLVLSNNVISSITGSAFRNLSVLRTLSLDHNLLSSPSLDRLTFSWLRKLETLHLGHNAIKEIRGSWFQNTDSLKTLLLEGNLLSFLNSSTFASSDLRSLETLDLSDNLISYVGRDTFRNLPRLGSLDLSRNRLQNAPDAFSYLSRLSMLNLDLNLWRCSCELRELAGFLNSYVQSAEKVLYNGRRMACASSDNPKVQTVLEVNEVNCIPGSGNMTADVNATSPITSQRYIRDVTIAVVCSCLGGVVITLAVLALVHRKSRRRFKPTQETKEPARQTWDFSEGSMSYTLHNSNYRGHPQWHEEQRSSDSRADTTRNHFFCQNCALTSRRRTNRGIPPNMEEEWSTYMDGWKDTFPKIDDEGGSPQRHPSPREDTSTMRMHQIALRRHMSIAQRQTFTAEERRNSKIATHKNRSFLTHQHGGRYGDLPAQHRPRNYMDDIQVDISRNHEERSLPRSSKVIVYRDILNYNQSNMKHQDGTQARVQRSVTFDLSVERSLYVSRKEGPYKIATTKIARTLGPKSTSGPGEVPNKGTIQESRNLKIPKPRSQGQRKLKVKLNLNPFRKSQVFPKSGSDAKDVRRTSRKIKKDKSRKSRAEKPSEEQKSEEKSTISETSPSEESPTRPSETQSSEKNPDESNAPMQTSNLSAETQEPLGTTNTTDHYRIPTLDLNLALSAPRDGEEKEFHTPRDGEEKEFHTPRDGEEKEFHTPRDGEEKEFHTPRDGEVLPNDFITPVSSTVSVLQEFLSSGDGSPKRKIRLIVPEKISSRPQTALEKKIR